jgi:hypothetical protein
MKESQYDYDDPNIPEEYYDSEEWLNYLELIRQDAKPDHYLKHRPQQQIDRNWQLLKEEKLLPSEEPKKVLRISNCRVTVWYDSGMPSINYDVRYSNGTQILDRRLNGDWTNEEAKTSTEYRAYDSVMTMLVRSDVQAKVRFTRFYPTKDVKKNQRDVNLIEIWNGHPQAAWFIVNQQVYPARLDDNGLESYTWSFNGRKGIAIDRFCDQCWNAVSYIV